MKPTRDTLRLFAILVGVWLLASLGRATAADGPSTPQAPPSNEQLEALVGAIKRVGPHGQGHAEATQAWQQLARAEAAQLPTLLAGFDSAGPLAVNWLRAAVEAIAERHLRAGGKLPAAELEKFVCQRERSPAARRLAYELLCSVDPSAPERLLPSMLEDPSLELRRDAVALALQQAEAHLKADQTDKALAGYRKAFSAARDLDQITDLAERLAKLGHQVDVRRHLGLIVQWKLIGPLDNTGGKGFDAVYPPEQQIDLNATYDGKNGKVRWIDYQSKDQLGKVDFNDSLGEQKAVVAYAYAEFHAAQQQQVQFRLSSFNAVKLWVNGELVDRRDVYHSGAEWDQYISTATLRQGHNQILVKVCQNEQTQSWARHWWFQLRVCDATGAGLTSQRP